jgi:LIM-domain binding protein
VIWNGRLEVRFAGDKMDQLFFDVDRCDQYIPRSKLEDLCAQASPAPTKSPRISKNATTKKGTQGKAAPSFDLRNLPAPLVNELGITSSTQMWLEVISCPLLLANANQPARRTLRVDARAYIILQREPRAAVL